MSTLTLALIGTESAVASCRFDLPSELTLPGVVLEASNNAGIVDARPGCLVWFETYDEGDTPNCTNLQVNVLNDVRPNEDEDPIGAPIDVTVERIGPHYRAFRLPLDVEPGTRIKASVTCDNGTEVGGSMTVFDTVPLKPPSLAFAVTNVELFSWSEPPCQELFASDTTNHQTFIDVELGDDVDTSRVLLLDAWLVEPGDPRPAENAERVTDGLIIPSGLATFRVYVHTPGAFDAHLRLTDALTGATSDVVVVPIETPPTIGGGSTSCAQSSPSSAVIVLSALVAFNARRCRRRLA